MNPTFNYSWLINLNYFSKILFPNNLDSNLSECIAPSIPPKRLLSFPPWPETWHNSRKSTGCFSRERSQTSKRQWWIWCGNREESESTGLGHETLDRDVKPVVGACSTSTLYVQDSTRSTPPSVMYMIDGALWFRVLAQVGFVWVFPCPQLISFSLFETGRNGICLVKKGWKCEIGY